MNSSISMKISHTLTTMAFLLALTACGGGGGGGGESSDNKGGLTDEISSSLVLLEQARAANKIVLEIDSSGEEHRFDFTDGTSLSIDQELVSNVNQIPENWSVSITFQDSRNDGLYLLGSSLDIASQHVTLNPTGTTPLSAELDYVAPAPGTLRVVVPAINTNGISIGKHFSSVTQKFSYPILGLYEDHENIVEFYFHDAAGNELASTTVSIRTSALSSKPALTIISNNLQATDDKVYMAIAQAHAFDQSGSIRWAYTGKEIGQWYDRLPNGNWLASNSADSVIYHWSKFSEVDMLGRTIRRYTIDKQGHHELRRLSDGNIVLASNSVPVTPADLFVGGNLREDIVFEIDAADGSIVKTYDFNTILDPGREYLPDNDIDSDWLHINGIVEDVNDDSLIVSGRNQSVTVKIDRASEDLVWILGAHEGWGPEHQEYLLTPVDSNGNAIPISAINFWPYAQHAPALLPNGNLILYDNGTDRGHYKETPDPANTYSRAVEYRIDTTSMTVEKVWEYDYMRSIFTPATGDVDFLPDTNTRLIGYMWGSGGILETPRMVELDSMDNIVFEAVIDPGENYYRVEKFDLYENID